MKNKKDNLTPDLLIGFGGSIKTLSGPEEISQGTGRIGGHLVLWGSPEQRDFYKDYFAEDTYLGPADGDGKDVTINHRMPIKTGDAEVDAVLKKFTDPIFKRGGLKTTRDERGIFAEVVCDLSDQYDAMVYDLAERGKLKWSSGAASHMIERDPNGRLKMFVITEGALTPMPAEPRMVTSRVMPLKAYVDFLTPQGSSQPGRPPQLTHGVKAMNILDATKKLVPGLNPEQLDAVVTLLGLGGFQIGAADAVEAPLEGDPEAEPLRSITIETLSARLKSLGYTLALPGQEPAARKPAAQRPPLPFGDQSPAPAEDAHRKSLDAFYITRFGDEDSAKKAILADVIGGDYRQRILEQNQAFSKFMRYGEARLDASERKALNQQIYPLEEIQRLVREGMSIGAIKTTMVEAQLELGGAAVPPNFQSEIVSRLPGRTAVRGSGARVVTLNNANSIEIPVYDGGDDRYRGNLRGQWGDETQSSSEQNAKTKLVTVPAHIYTYKVSMSRSLVEDASNLVALVQQDMSDTLIIDEDEVFLLGDGVGKPKGILPGGANTLSLKEVISGNASALTTAGIKNLKRGVASQYRQDGVWVGNSDTYAAIEVLTVSGTGSDFAFPDLSDSDMLLARRAFESEAMADVAANAFPLLYGVMRGYTIVERLGMTIDRFNDSGTGANKIEYHLRRRIGGIVTHPWLFAIQKVAAN